MTGIERLRELVDGINPATRAIGATRVSYDREHPETVGMSLRDLLSDIADQIGRERGEVDRDDRWVVPVDRGSALDCEVMVDPEMGERFDEWLTACEEEAKGHEAAAQTGRGPGEDVSMSAYDRLPKDDREAIAWVRRRGGLEIVKARWAGRVALSNVRYMAERHRARVARMRRHIEFVERKCRERQARIVGLNKENSELRRRSMPDGYEWPKRDDGTPVILSEGQGEDVVETVAFHYQTAHIDHKSPYVVINPTLVANTRVVCLDMGERLGRRAPAIAGDGKPLLEGETVWDVDGCGPLTVFRLPDKSDIRISLKKDGTFYYRYAEKLTHERPDSWERLEEDAEKLACEYFGREGEKAPCSGCRSREIDPCTAKDCEFNKTIDLVRRAKALAGDA